LAVSDSVYFNLLRPNRDLSRAESVSLFPDVFVRPITLEAADHLFPEEENAPQHRLINKEIPALREKIEADTGLQIPPVHIRANDTWPPGDYTLLLNDTPIVGGNVGDGTDAFCPDESLAEANNFPGWRAFNPESEQFGIWVPETYWEEARAAGIELWDPYKYLMVHLEAFIRRHLARFAGYQETVNMLDRWLKENIDRRSWLQEILPDVDARVRLVGVLQGLLDENVPIRSLDVILEAQRSAGDDGDMIGIIEDARKALKPELPGNDGSRKLIALPSEFEAAIEDSLLPVIDTRLFAMDPNVAQDLLYTVGSLIGDLPHKQAAFVVKKPELRPYVRRLIELEYPSVAVLSEQELVGDLSAQLDQVELSQ
jgi:flagellar biosynthesis protein FlhA